MVAATWGVPLTIVTVVGCGDPFQRTTQVDCGTGVGTPASELCKLTAIVKGWPPAGMEIGNVVRLHVCAKETLQASGKKQNKSLFIRKLEFNTSNIVCSILLDSKWGRFDWASREKLFFVFDNSPQFLLALR